MIPHVHPSEHYHVPCVALHMLVLTSVALCAETSLRSWSLLALVRSFTPTTPRWMCYMMRVSQIWESPLFTPHHLSMISVRHGLQWFKVSQQEYKLQALVDSRPHRWAVDVVGRLYLCSAKNSGATAGYRAARRRDGRRSCSRSFSEHLQSSSMSSFQSCHSSLPQLISHFISHHLITHSRSSRTRRV